MAGPRLSTDRGFGHDEDRASHENGDIVNTRYDAETLGLETPAELRARAARIRERSKMLVDELGADHPLVARALDKARHLEREADELGIDLRRP